MKTITTIGVACLLELGLDAGESLGTNGPIMILRKAPAAELADTVALLVKESKPKERSATTIELVRAAVRINPAATLAIVGAVAHTVPEMAALDSQTAAREQPGLAAAIARAAVAGAPTHAADIVVAVCSVAPVEYRSIAVAAARAAPSASREILAAIACVRVELKPYIDKELAAYDGAAPSVATCLDRAQMAHVRAAAAFLGPGTESAPIPGGGGPPIPQIQTELIGSKPLRLGETPPGGRNYARP